jgi:hypothetical protein
MAAVMLNTVKTQLPMLVEKFEPQIEAKLRESLRALKASHPEEIAIFYPNWVKLNKAVQEELGATPSVGAKRRKTRKHKKRT